MTDREKLDDLFADGKCPAWFIDNKQRLDTVDYLIARGATVNEWISVKDRLPDKGQTVLIYRKKHGIDEATHRGYGVWKIGLFEETTEWLRVTHWMPLPEPPKEVE